MKNISKIFLIVPKFDNRKFLILMIIVIITVMIDSEIGIVADFIPEQISSIGNWCILRHSNNICSFTVLYSLLSQTN